VPIRIIAFATMLHQGWSTRPSAAGAARSRMRPLVPRLAALLVVAAVAMPAAAFVSARQHQHGPAARPVPVVIGQEVILEAPGAQPADG
jgi:hypothetical protein